MPHSSIVFPKGMVRAAGAVVWRLRPDCPQPVPGQPVAPKDIEVLLVHRPKYRDWGWPKGKAEQNEPLPVSAVREVEEETGELIALGAPLTTQRYRLGSGHLKEVYYWSGHALPNSSPAAKTRMPVTLASLKEIDVSKWMTTKKAGHILTRRGDRRLLMELIGRAARGDLLTTTVTFLRHAHAISRDKWEGSDGTRPLDRQGVTQALDLVHLMSAFGVERVIASPWKRCEQTVAPYVALSNSKFVSHKFLTEKGVRKEPQRSSALVKTVMSEFVSTLISFHRPGFNDLIAPMREISSRKVESAIDQPKTGLRLGEMLVVHVVSTECPRAVGAERHRPFDRQN